MRCANCLHAAHAGARCAHRAERLHLPTGVTVVEMCRCKQHVDEVRTPAPVAAPVAERESEPIEAEPATAESDGEAEPPPAKTRRAYGGKK